MGNILTSTNDNRAVSRRGIARRLVHEDAVAVGVLAGWEPHHFPRATIAPSAIMKLAPGTDLTTALENVKLLALLPPLAGTLPTQLA